MLFSAIAIYSHFLVEDVGVHLPHKLGAGLCAELCQHVLAVVGYGVVADE